MHQAPAKHPKSFPKQSFPSGLFRFYPSRQCFSQNPGQCYLRLPLQQIPCFHFRYPVLFAAAAPAYSFFAFAHRALQSHRLCSYKDLLPFFPYPHGLFANRWLDCEIQTPYFRRISFPAFRAPHHTLPTQAGQVQSVPAFPSSLFRAVYWVSTVPAVPYLQQIPDFRFAPYRIFAATPASYFSILLCGNQIHFLCGAANT